ncbi:hypothetical protein K432DRAFT_299180 [Lepidopterella palustris CBS 459.81]|uniref:Spindle pole body component n=1 Tax=Lepidopterella palustris CBS 459.81 TaxID=1314670 RepID=A0A8E2JEJ6_9PEZI|nr:hypothetical protein K432DRAFT_299180 [Lepidopterella palustris CBS 459.81]
MAQSARIGTLTDELIASITGFSHATNAQAFKHAKDLATKGLRAHHYARTNQFDVRAKLDGLDEKFRVLNRDDLADALLIRLKELDKISNKWTPESLCLLLQLSDRPVEVSNASDLELLKPLESPPPLTWAEIIADDPLDEEGIWENIDYAAESSEDEKSYRGRDKAAAANVTPPSRLDEEEVPIHAETYVVPVGNNSIAEIEKAQFWRQQSDMTESLPDPTHAVEVTELQAIRESLFMLAGLPTSLFVKDEHGGEFRSIQNFSLGHAITGTTNHLFSGLGSIGYKIYRTRQWTSKKPQTTLSQTFQAVVMKRISEFDRYLALLQQRYFAPEPAVPVSLLEIHNQVRQAAIPLLHLAALVDDVSIPLDENPFLHLETLFERTILAQMTGEDNVFQYLAKIFFDCLQTYLKPIRKWMESGELGGNEETFFVFMNDKSSETSSLWHDQFALRRNKSGVLYAPKVLHPVALKIFNTGKSIVFLKQLGIHREKPLSNQSEPRLDFEAVCGTSSTSLLAPFSELFDSAFEKWISSKYNLASQVLREQLFSECGLWRILNAFNHIYLAADGSLFQDFADAMFERLDRLGAGWNDRFLLTELAHGTFGAVLGASDAEKIVIRTSSPKQPGRTVKNLTVVFMDYMIPWSIMNIIQRSSIPIYQQAFSFLLQVYRAKYLLQNVDWKTNSTPGDHDLTQLSYKLRYRLIWFTDILRSYLAETVFAPSRTEMAALLANANDIDAMAEIHSNYINKLQDQCLLSKNLSPIHSAILSLLDLGILFSDVHAQKSRNSEGLKTGNMQSPQKNQEAQRKRFRNHRRSVVPVPESSSEDDDDGDDYDADAESFTSHEETFRESLARIQEQFDRLLPFVTIGLRSIGRASGEACWDTLAERLDWDRPGGSRS